LTPKPFSGAAMIAVPPETTTEEPKWSLIAPSLSIRAEPCWVHVVPDRMKMYAAPCMSFVAIFLFGAPTTAVSPETDTEVPNWSPLAPSPASSTGPCSAQSVPERTNTYAAPWLLFAPTLWKYAPMTAVSPDRETALPNESAR
jgi:hypothetical protein